MSLGTTYDPDEIAAYDAIRLKLLAYSKTHPEILEIPIVDEDAKCAICDAPKPTEFPIDHWSCAACGSSYTRLQANDPSWRKWQRKTHRAKQAQQQVSDAHA